MTFDERIDSGWSDHDRDPEGVARRLRDAVPLIPDASAAGGLVALSNHVLGHKLGRWSEAAGLDAAATAGRAGQPGLLAALAGLPLAALLGGDGEAALVAELRAAALLPEQAAATFLRVRFLVVEAWAKQGRWEPALELLAPALDLAGRLPPRTGADRTIAVCCNNVASALLERNPRSEAEDALLERTARAAHALWMRPGTWVNDERGRYLLALVLDGLGRHAEAWQEASAGLEVIARNGDEPVDRAFLLVARAAAARGLGREADRARDVAAASELARGFDDPSLVEWLGREIARAGPPGA